MATVNGSAGANKLGVWALRSLVIGSSIVTVWHLTPIVYESSGKNLVTLVKNPDVRFATQGARRMSRQANWGQSRRRMLLKHGAVSALVQAVEHSDANVRDEALNALASFTFRDSKVSTVNDARVPPSRMVGFKSVANAIVDDDCGKGCQRLWEAITALEFQSRASTRQDRVQQLQMEFRSRGG